MSDDVADELADAIVGLVMDAREKHISDEAIIAALAAAIEALREGLS